MTGAVNCHRPASNRPQCLLKGRDSYGTNMQRIHEPEAELSTLEEALEDAEVVRAYLERKRQIQSGQSITLRVPLQAVIEAIDQMEEPVLQQVAQHVERRLALIALPLLAEAQ